MHIVKLANCTLYINMYSLSALYLLWSVPIVKSDSCYILQKKKKKRKKMTRTSVWVKIPKVMPKKTPAIYLFLGKGRESFVSNFIKTKLSALSALPSSTQTFSIQTQCGRRTPKLTKKFIFFYKFGTFPVTEGYAI